jgi:hypothetical protein
MNFNELIDLEQTCDAAFKTGANGVTKVKATADRKVELVSFESGKQLALVKSARLLLNLRSL